MAMTIFLYPIFRKDSEELATGMVLFRGALEGTFYFLSTLGFLALVVLGNEYIATGADSAALQSMGNVLYWFQDRLAPVGSIFFLIGATCLYISFYRTRLIPRWLSVWGFIGVVFYMASPLLKFFNMDPGYWFLFGNGDCSTGNGNGGLVDREGIQSICDRCPVC